MARRDTSPRPVLRPEGFGAAEQTERMLQPEGDPLAPTEVLKTGITKEVMDKAQEYVSNPPPPKQQSPVQKAIDKSLIGGAEEDYEVKVSKVTPEGRGAIRGMISRVLGKKFNGNLDAFYYCTTFVSDMLDSIGADPLNTKGDPYNRTRANAYMKYGTPVDLEDIQEGDIVIFDFPKLPDGTLTLDPTRGKRNGLGDHATFYAGDRLDVNKPGSGYIGVLGGEQGGGAAISMKAFDKSHILGIRRIQYNDIDYEFTKELAKVNPDFNKFLNNEAKAFDFNAFMEQSSNPIQGTNRLTSGFDKGGLTESKGLSWGELIVDNILGLDNEYESFGEKLGKAINEDEIKFLKDAAVGVYEGTKEFVQAPVETTKQVVNEIKDSVTRLGSEDLNTRLQRMYNVTYEQATDEQVNQAREAVLGDALTALELIPAAKVTTTVAGAAIPSGLKADAIGQTKALLSGDREFLSGTPTNRATTQSLSAGFTGQNPPTYIPKDEPVFDPEDITTSGYDNRMFFREPIAEFTRKLTMTNSFPNKGMTGAEFLRLLEKNAESIPPSSYKEGLVDKDKRYTREELLDAVTNRRQYPPKSLYYSTADLDAPRAFENIQRQSEVGFTGYPTNKNSYFSIPITAQTAGKSFKANSQHFDPRTTAHVRGSFVDAMVGYDVNETLSPRFKSIIGREDKYLLVEEIQSDLLQKGYRKPKNSFDTAFDRATEEALRGTQTTFQESYGDITNDLKSLIKTLDSKNLEMPEEPLRLRPVFRPGALNRNGNPQFKDRRKRDFLDGIASRGTVDGVSYVDFDEIMDYINKQGVNSTHIYQVFRDLVDKANRPGYLYGDDRIAFTGPDGTVYNDIIISQTNDQGVKRFYVNPDSEDYKRATEAFDFYSRDFGLNYDEILEIYEGEIDEYYNAIGKEIEGRGLDKDIERPLVSNIYENFRENKKLEETLGDQTNTALPPIRKNKQTVEEALKLLIAKADQQGVDKIVIPPAERIALARGRTIEPDDRGDRFYRTYVTDLDKALKDLEKNYPVTVHRDVELPYRNIADVYDPDDDIDLDDIDEIFNENDTDLFFTVDEEGELTPEDQALQNLLAGGADTEVTPEVANQIDQMIANMLQDPTEEIVEETLKESAKEPSKLGTIIDISKLREQFQVDKPRQFAEGGAVNNMSMKQQMSLFEYGGIADDGMTKDPVSGNNIPPGSLAKEVRDDIPAMLSEGEYVVPADVLRYYGVNFFENLRGQAKQGLQNMEQNGRIGGTPMTQQDVARNMQQPMMAPAPVQAAQGAMMQSPIRIQQQPAPQAMGNAMPQQQPIMANQGTMVQGFDQGTADPRANEYRSGWSPARARYNTQMFQGTSSQQANIAAAQEQANANAGEEITQLRMHYNQQGESAQVEYVGTDPANMSIKQTEANLAIVAAYPLTEEEWLAYKKEMSRGSGEGGGEDPTPTGSDTSWMDGIDWNDKQSVKDWIESDDGLGMSPLARGIAEKGGIIGAIPQGIQAQDIAKARGIRDYYASIKDEEMVSYLDGKINEAMENPGLLTSALDKLGLMTGKTYLKQMMDLDPVVPDNVPGFQIRANRLKQKVAENAEAQKAIDDAAAQKALEAAQRAQREHRAGDDDDPFEVTNVQIDRDPMGQGTMTTTYEGIDPGLTTASFEEDPEIDFGVNKGGLMTAPKPKKKTRKYNKGGLAGKK